jgi:methylmalonyl-CoA mutase cobalamin-binding subunit
VIAHYALGGGLGHLVRARAVAEALGQADRAVLVTASVHAGDERVTGGMAVARVPDRLARDPAALRVFIEDLRPDELVVDAFPAGILGELCGFDAAPCRHVARRLRWGRYARRLDGPLPRFVETFVLEPLEASHARALERASDRVVPLDLPPAPAARPRAAMAEPHWLVVHAGPEAEVAELVAHARERMALEGADARLVVIAPARPPELPADALWLDAHPAAPYFAAAERIVTAAGFNAMRETAPHAARHHPVPFPRPLDDQYARAARAAAGAA